MEVIYYPRKTFKVALSLVDEASWRTIFTFSFFLFHFTGLYKKIPQMNNFVVYEGFFANKEHASDIDGRRMHITAR